MSAKCQKRTSHLAQKPQPCSRGFACDGKGANQNNADDTHLIVAQPVPRDVAQRSEECARVSSAQQCRRAAVSRYRTFSGPRYTECCVSTRRCDTAARKRRERTLLSAARHREVQAVLQSGACLFLVCPLPSARSLGCKAGASALDAMSAFWHFSSIMTDARFRE